MRLTAFFKIYKMCALLHRCDLKILAKHRFEKSAIFVKIKRHFLQMLQNLQNIAKIQNFQLDNLVDFEKCCKTHICLQRSAPIQPRSSETLPKLCQALVAAEGAGAAEAVRRGGGGGEDERAGRGAPRGPAGPRGEVQGGGAAAAED